MSLPAVLGANVLEIKDALASNLPIEELPMYLVGVAVSAVVGYFAIRLVKSLSDKGKFGKFAYYCWAVGWAGLVGGHREDDAAQVTETRYKRMTLERI